MNDKNTEELELFSQEELEALNPHLKLKKDRTFLLQPNIISRSINDVEATEKKLMALAMSYIPYKIENDDKKALFKWFDLLDEYLISLGYEPLGKREDIIEELVGEIYDEDDEIITNIVKLDDNKYECAGDVNIGDLLETLDLDEDLITTEYSTIGGWMTDILEHIPEAGESTESGVFRLTAAEVREQNVEKVIIEILPTDDTEDSEDDE